MNDISGKKWIPIAGIIIVLAFLFAYWIIGIITYHPYYSPSMPESTISIACNDSVSPAIDVLASAYTKEYGIYVDVQPSSGNDDMLIKATDVSLIDMGVLTRGLTFSEANQGINQIIIAHNSTTNTPIVLIARGDTTKNNLTKFMYFALGPEGQSILSDEGLTPVKKYPSPINASQRTEPYAGEFYARYFYTAEPTYVDIVVNNSTLYYTYFDITDSNVKIDPHDVRQVALWRQEDLKTAEAGLSGSDVEGLIDLINQTGFMGMNATYGGAGSYQRYYPFTISVKYGGKEKNVTYQSYMGSTPAPEGFKAIRDRMRDLVYEYLQGDALYLNDGMAFDRSQATPTPIPSAVIPDSVTINNMTYQIRHISIAPVNVTVSP